MQYTCLLVDDDEIDRLTALSFIKKHSFLTVSGVFSTVKEALSFLETNEIDILFLDIDMPEENGLELRKKALHIPICVFITSHPEHAVESFELETLDFIIKPIKSDRFEQTIRRINDFMEIKQKATLFESSIGGGSIYIKEGHEHTKIKLHDILYLEALKDYTLIHTKNKRHCVLTNLGTLIKETNFHSFIRIHRSFAVQKQYISKINTQEILLNNEIKLPIGRAYRSNLDNLM